MNAAREAFLQRVRQAVAAGNRAGAAPGLPSRGHVGYQGAGPDPVVHFRDELTAAGGHAHVVADREAAVVRLLELVQEKSAQRVLLSRGPWLDSLGLSERLHAQGVEVVHAGEPSA